MGEGEREGGNGRGRIGEGNDRAVSEGKDRGEGRERQGRVRPREIYNGF